MSDVPAPSAQPVLMKDGMARPSSADIRGWLMRGEVGMAVGVIGVILLLILPVPKFLLDLLLAISLVSSVLILMTALMMKRPLDFAIFPTVLLVSTLFRLGLNLASTRLVLTHGHEGHDAAGQVINAFGQLMMGGDFIIGIIIFAIILVVNFVVITKGSTRIAEVSARFTLDSMPGKQMAIDADLSSGLITEDQAKIRRKELEQESTFFGAMDGASKFVRGDAVAGLIIVAINAIGGMLIGVVQHGLPIGEAASTYVQLTIGDGLVTQVPAIIISIAAGFLVSKAGVEGSADKALVQQLATNPVSLGMVAGAAGLLALIPGMPIIPFAALAAGAGFMAWRQGRARLKPQPTEAEKAAAEAASKPKDDAEEPIGTALTIDEVKIELGYSLLTLINDLEGRRLTDQVRALRRALAQEFGFVMPSVRILDNMRLPTQGYAIRIKEMEAGAGEVRLGSLMAMDPSGRQVELPGEHTKEPAFGLPATWIDENLREEATFRGYTIVDPSTVLTTHLTEILKENMADLLSYAEVQKLLKELGPEEKKLVEELIPSVVTVTTLQRVLQALLREKVSIRDLGAILEGLAEAAPHSSSVTTLVEHVRTRLARQLCWQHKADDGALPIITLSPDWEAAFAEALVGQGEDKQLAMAPSRLQDFIRSVRDVFERAAMAGESAVLLTGPQIRPYVRSIIERFRGQTVVMSQNEVHPKARLRTLGSV
ncbi:flagellar biosynthesis protein FlhA [Brevundimonas staleyi]|uniref:Flagellar biosynthesis protein FlhA n=1 Tax=Brevundimonas staleyi TaxID=74326 RepID=A0ABW0FM03_9CAUL